VQLSDTHLSRWDGPLRRNFRTLVHFVNTVLKPDLVINSGDIILSNPEADDDYRGAAELHGLISAPVRYVPGNHDVGEAYDSTWWATTSERMDRYRRHFGDTQWIEWLGEFALIGFNSQILGLGLEEEKRQWRWLEEIAPTLAGRNVILFQHMSFWTPYSGSDKRPGGISDTDRARVLSTLGGTRLWGVANGHVHRYRKTRQGDAYEVWAPPTSFLVDEEESALLPAGLEQLGVVLYEFTGDQVHVTFQTTPGLEAVMPGGFEESGLIRGEIAAARKAFDAG
jgi:3',5'-cyclic AMP phosphodiesterase CpdA